MTDGRYLNQEFLEDCIGCTQPPTDQLPSITNHYTFIRFKKDYKRFKAGYRPVPRNLLPRVQRIIKSMVDMDIIEPRAYRPCYQHHASYLGAGQNT